MDLYLKYMDIMTYEIRKSANNEVVKYVYSKSYTFHPVINNFVQLYRKCWF